MKASITAILIAAALAGCGGGPTGDVIVPDSTHVLDDAARTGLISYDEATGTIVATAPVLADLSADDIVVSEPVPDIAPDGFLRRVVSVSTAGGQVTVTTAQAALADGMQKGALQTSIPVTADMIDMSRTTTVNPSVTISGPAAFTGANPAIPPGSGFRINFNNTRLPFGSNTITFNGSVAIDANINIDISIDWFQLQHAVFDVSFAQDADVTVDGDFSIGFGPEPTLTTIWLSPVDIQIGPIPVVFVPKIVFKLGIKPTVSFSVAALHFTDSASAEVGVEYQHDTDTWTEHDSSDATGSLDMDSFPQFGLKVDVYPRAEVELLLYNALGPYVWTNGGLVFDAATPRHPFFKAGIHVEGGLGGRFDLVDDTVLNLIDYAPSILDETFWFYQTPNLNPILDVHSPPGSGLTVGGGQPVDLHADVFDLEDGPFSDGHITVAWSSDVDGPLGTNPNMFAVHLSPVPGPRTITLTATDSDGGVSTWTGTITVDHPKPVASITGPRSIDTNYTGVPRPLTGLASDPFFPGVDLCTVSGFTFTWASTNAGDSIANPGACPTTGTTIAFANGGTPRTVSLTVTNPWGGNTVAQAILTPQTPSPTAFACVSATSPAPGPYVADMNFVLTPALTLSAFVNPSCAVGAVPSGALTYTWTATATHADGTTVTADIGTGQGLSWQPKDTPGMVDSAAAYSPDGEQIDITVRATDQVGNSGTGTVTIHFSATVG